MKNFLIIFFSFFLTATSAQIKDPIKFDLKLNEFEDNQYEAELVATLEKNWHIYSKDIPEDSGIPTKVIVFGDNIIPIGDFIEVGKKQDEFSEAFGTRIVYYSDKVSFKQKFKLKDHSKIANLKIEVTYQICDDRVCLSPNTLEFEQEITPKNVVLKKDAVNIFEPKDNTTNKTPETKYIADNNQSLKISSFDYKNPLTHCENNIHYEENSSNFWILGLGFIGGLIALLTPCVFPMIPLTVSFFTKGSKNRVKGRRDAILYGLFILVIFVTLSLPFHIIDGISGNIFNEISTNIWLNLFFFIVFVVFALSFFGYYEIKLPNWLANKSSRAEDVGGIVGICFMALTLIIVSFSCTGPILGSLLGSTITGTSNVPTMLTFALFGFGLAWAIIFGSLALFPQVLEVLPKSGGWMNTMKVILGFIELALAFKFLSKADLVSKTFLLKRELFIGIWIIIATGLLFYLLKAIKFPHDDQNNGKITLTRKFFALFIVGFIVYLSQGLVKSNTSKLNYLSGIIPPINVSYFHDEKDGIWGIYPEHDYFKAVEKAKQENKPILIDFTGYGCENCRKMEEFVWSKEDILPILKEEVVLASLYVDDKEKLPTEEQTMLDMGNGRKKKIKTIGDKWSFFQQVNFNNNSQPHYVLVTPEGKIINTPVSGYMDKEDFKKFLKCGINFYKQKVKNKS